MSYIEIDGSEWRFQPRVAAVCVWREHVLLQHALDGDFWVLLGGRIRPLEVTADALRRTMRWEIAQDVTVQRLLWVMEFVTTVGGRPLHEIGFYYAVELPERSPFLDLARDHTGMERGHPLLLRWFHIDSMPAVPLFPTFLRTALLHIPGNPEHIVHSDTDPPTKMGTSKPLSPSS